jgi:gluconokinase
MTFSEPAQTRPRILIVAGVSGSGKTTVGAMLAGRLHWPFADADSFQPPANIEKMHAGIPLTDADRWPWLERIADWMDDHIENGRSAVITCSALRRTYRDMLLHDRPWAWLVFLAVDRDELARRLASRHGHFFPAQLLDSQLSALEPPQPDERAIAIPETGGPADTVESIVSWVNEADAGPA